MTRCVLGCLCKKHNHRQPLTNKKCVGCGEVKPSSAFYVRRNRNSLLSRCKECMRDTGTRARVWRTENPEKADTIITRCRAKRFGLTLEAYSALILEYGQSCNVCGASNTSSFHRRLSLDHDHKTNELRGFLCGDCNHALGNVKDSVERLEGLINYLRRPPLRVRLRIAS